MLFATFITVWHTAALYLCITYSSLPLLFLGFKG